MIGAEIGLLTPPLGISCFTIKSTIQDKSITLAHIFTGAFPFAFIMLLVLILIIAYPVLSLALLYVLVPGRGRVSAVSKGQARA